MLINYLKIALRNLQKQKVFAFINVLGLSVGVACFVLLMLFIGNELSFDKFHKNAANIYRLYINSQSVAQPGSIERYSDMWSPSGQSFGEGLKQDIPDVVNYVRLQLPWGESLVRAGNKVLPAQVSFADPSFFSVFRFPLRYGSKSTALHDRHDIVLSTSRAKQLFGNDDAVGKTVQIQLGATYYAFRVSAVARDVPSNSTIKFDILGSFPFISSYRDDYFTTGNIEHRIVRQTFVQLRPGSTLANNPARMDHFTRTFFPPGSLDGFISAIHWHKKDLPLTLNLQPLLHIHTDSWLQGAGFEDDRAINPKTIWILAGIAAGILLITCINFTTLAIGRSAGRSKEVGVRKVIGAARKQLIFQFFTEALVMSFIAMLLGLLFAQFLLPWFNQLAGRQLHFSFWFNPKMILLLLATMLTVGLLAGSYPALVLSGFKPIEVLKNKLRVGGTNFFTRLLVTFQFVLSILLIIGTGIILQQTHYLIHKDVGFDKENMIAIDASDVDPGKVFPPFKADLGNYPEIVGVTSAVAGLGVGRDLLAYRDKGLSVALNIVDPDYVKVMGMQLLTGRNFVPSDANDTVKRVIINETMMRNFGWDVQSAVGQGVKHFRSRTAAYVIGVVRDFNFRPLSENVTNQAFEVSTDKGYPNVYVRIKAGDPAKALARVRNAWAAVVPGVPMKYSYLDESIKHYYDNEQRWSSIMSWAGGISIFLASLGLLGLAMLAAVNRTKEIGIRKVLGASVSQVVILLSGEFIRLILLAFIIATPVAWYFMNLWLQGYAARINIGWWIFALTGTGAILVALITVGSQSVKVARANPVKSLRTE
ncbi:MAG TPA: ABC transporter permease [Mucilaginibacter sp.]|jgi:putative ABC transport system permease protein|nr:ABC transporter permease [Mucilaginibacter sp.]